MPPAGTAMATLTSWQCRPTLACGWVGAYLAALAPRCSCGTAVRSGGACSAALPLLCVWRTPAPSHGAPHARLREQCAQATAGLRASASWAHRSQRNGRPARAPRDGRGGGHGARPRHGRAVGIERKLQGLRERGAKCPDKRERVATDGTNWFRNGLNAVVAAPPRIVREYRFARGQCTVHHCVLELGHGLV